ncbi:MAG: hypothetical protein ABIK92_08705 [Pseudomonadota bacterium]
MKYRAFILIYALIFLLTLSTADCMAADYSNRMILKLDASGSMWGQIDGKAKIVIAKEVLNDLIDTMPQDFSHQP